MILTPKESHCWWLRRCTLSSTAGSSEGQSKIKLQLQEFWWGEYVSRRWWKYRYSVWIVQSEVKTWDKRSALSCEKISAALPWGGLTLLHHDYCNWVLLLSCDCCCSLLSNVSLWYQLLLFCSYLSVFACECHALLSTVTLCSWPLLVARGWPKLLFTNGMTRKQVLLHS